MPKFSFAIVGCGHIAHKHAQAISATPGCQLVAVCESDFQRGISFAQAYNAKWYPDYNTMLENPAVDIVSICTPSGMHAWQGIAAAMNGKHVLLEKPMALSLADADLLIKQCQQAGVQLAVVYQNRFKPAIQNLRQAMEQQLFGKLTHGNATVRWNRNEEYYAQRAWRGTAGLDGGVLMNQAIHNIDLLQWLMGPVDSLFAYTSTRLRKIETEDIGVGVLQFSSGALGVIEAASTIYPKNLEESLSIFGSSGSAVISGVTASVIQTWLFEEEPLINENTSNYTGHQAVIADLISAITNGHKPLVDGIEGKKSLEIVLALYESASKGIPVEIGQSG